MQGSNYFVQDIESTWGTWNTILHDTARADPVIPREAPLVTLEEMPMKDTPSYEQTDSTIRMQGHTADALMLHSVGHVRDWDRRLVSSAECLLA
jgi:hypothetical protein